MFPQENEYKSLLPKNAHGSPNFDKAACTALQIFALVNLFVFQYANVQNKIEF